MILNEHEILIIEFGQVLTENASRTHGFGSLNLSTSAPYPKNPIIGAFFREIHRAEELGSGMRKLKRYGKVFGGEDPELIEGDVSRIIIKGPEFGEGAHSGSTKLGQVTPQVTHQVIQLIEAVRGEMSRSQLMEALALKDRVNFAKAYLEPAIKAQLVEMTQPESPKSPTQKYRLTEKGRKIIKAGNP
jgi:ATP-dependent DNA helicase RecG